MLGYWQRPDETAHVLRDGWLYTGDIARVDSDGYYYIVDRKKDMVISGGYNVYPAEVENILVEHPAVVTAAGVGAPDPVRGEGGHYFVVLAGAGAAEPDELIEHCRARLANYKVPVHLEIVDDLPMTPAGKIRKAELQQRVRGEA